jgi:cell division protein FtsB
VSEPAYHSSASKGIWHSLNRLVLTLIVLCAAVPIAYSFLPEVHKQREQDLRIEELKAEIEKKRMVLTRHQREESLLKHDPEYVGMIARDRLDLMQEGETIYRIGASPSASRRSQ